MRPVVHVPHTSYANGLTIYCWKTNFSVYIGAYCSIAEDVVMLLGGDHDVNWVSTYPFIEHWNINELNDRKTPKCRGNIYIGNDVWLGHGVTILSGTRIETGAIVAAGSVVKTDVPPYAIVGGNPAKIIRYRFEQSVCLKLLESKWWEAPENELRLLVGHMHDPLQFLSELEHLRVQ